MDIRNGPIQITQVNKRSKTRSLFPLPGAAPSIAPLSGARTMPCGSRAGRRGKRARHCPRPARRLPISGSRVQGSISLPQRCNTMPPNAPPPAMARFQATTIIDWARSAPSRRRPPKAVCGSVAAPPNVSPRGPGRRTPASSSERPGTAPAPPRQTAPGWRQDHPPQVPVDQHADQPDSRHRGAAEYQQGQVHRGAQADLGEERRDIGVEDVVRQHQATITSNTGRTPGVRST